MSKLVVILSVLFLSFSTMAQEYVPMPTENTTWSIIRTIVDPGPMDPSFISISHYSIVGDTLVNDTLYHQVKLSHGGEVFSLENSYGNILYREDENKRIWGREENEEILVFDFNLNEGDVFCFIYQPSGNMCHEVLLVDSIEINGEFRRQIHFESDGQEDIWVEGIGSLIYGLSGYWSFLGNFQDNLICFRQSDIQVYGTCEFPNGFTELNIEPKDVSIFPNPSESFIQIQSEFTELRSFNMTIFNVLGERVGEVSNMLINEPIDISGLTEGHYTILISDKNGLSFVSRFVKI